MNRPADRVQWFRAEAEATRWLEQYELKHVEFIRCRDAHTFAGQSWLHVAQPGSSESRSPGFYAYARRQAAMHKQLAQVANKKYRQALKKCGDGSLGAVPGVSDGRTLLSAVQEFRVQVFKWMSEYKIRPPYEHVPSLV